MTSAVLRDDLARVPAYAPTPLPDVTLDLRDNINLWGAPPAALAALQRLDAAAIAGYPAVGGGALSAALAEQLGVAPANVLGGCGSDDVIDAWLRAAGGAGDAVAHAEPSFAMLPIFARLNHLVPVGVPLRSDGAMDVDALLATGARLIYVCSPNNPTGTVTPRADLLRLFDAAPGTVLLDEAYAEFTDVHDLRVEAARRENVLVTRTFSKAWGLAGLRLGYGVGGARLVAAVAKARGPYKVSVPAERAAVAALRSDAEWAATVAREVVEVRTRLARALAARPGIRIWPSEGNFVFLQVPGSATDAAEAFRQRGIGVRAFCDLPGVGDALRIGVAPWNQLERVAAAALEIWP